MKMKKMNGADRRQSIIDAARPLFALHGYQAASVRKIAEAAGVSEALLYKHFPSKKELYREILSYSVDVASVLKGDLEGFEPGAEALTACVYFAVKLILTEVPRQEKAQYWHERLLFQSLIGDRAYAVEHFEHLQQHLEQPIGRHIEQARRDGDLVDLNMAMSNRFWFIHHLAMALNLCFLSGEPVFPYQGDRSDLVREAVLFGLRGAGLTDEALARCYQPDKLEVAYRRVYAG